MNPIPRNESESDEQFVYTLADRCFAYLERHGEDAGEKLTDEQHTLMAYVFLDSQVQEGGFLQLIATGYGDYVFANPLADSLRRWKIKPTPKILDQAKTLYQRYGAEIEELAGQGSGLKDIRRRYGIFEELDGEYYEASESDMQAVAEYIENEWPKFADLPE
ncbi:DMP19 family protein [Neisseria elongata]|uniref:DMP19 family protein n=1 Tax=Neisseria elongata TaxID=495 RepID=UPI00195B92D6|nr:DMP19 family protein [Neisseria elongata]MBM7064501.1 DMP19 family protein [Neisseria elongata]